jgi:hypothetical protein
MHKEAPHKILASHAPQEQAPARRQGDGNTMRSRMVLVVRRGWLNNERMPENTADAEVDDSGMKEVIQVSRSVAGDLIEDAFQAIPNLRNEPRRNKTREAPRLRAPSWPLLDEAARVHHGTGHQHAASSDGTEEHFPLAHPLQPMAPISSSSQKSVSAMLFAGKIPWGALSRCVPGYLLVVVGLHSLSEKELLLQGVWWIQGHHYASERAPLVG